MQSDGINILKESRDHYLLDGAYVTRRGNKQPRFQGVVTDQYRLFRTEDDLNELYDIKSDPDQLRNLYTDSNYKKVIQELEAKIK